MSDNKYLKPGVYAREVSVEYKTVCEVEYKTVCEYTADDMLKVIEWMDYPLLERDRRELRLRHHKLEY